MERSSSLELCLYIKRVSRLKAIGVIFSCRGFPDCQAFLHGSVALAHLATAMSGIMWRRSVPTLFFLAVTVPYWILTPGEIASALDTLGAAREHEWGCLARQLLAGFPPPPQLIRERRPSLLQQIRLRKTHTLAPKRRHPVCHDTGSPTLPWKSRAG